MRLTGKFAPAERARTRAGSDTSPWLLQRGRPAAPGWKRRKPCAREVAARVRRAPSSAPQPAVTWPSVYASRVLQLAVRRSSGSLAAPHAGAG